MDCDPVRDIRRFSRLYTQRVGALREDYLARGRPLGEARLIWETGSDGIEVMALRHRLGLDSGYLSRLLRSLERQKLVRVEAKAGDRRRRVVRLTAKGKREWNAYDQRSDSIARAMLQGLSEEEGKNLVSLLNEAARLIRKASVTLSEEDPASADARRCLDYYYRELDQRFEGGFDPGNKAYAGTGEGAPYRVHFVLAWLDGEAVGCGSLVWNESASEAGEIKRMWVAPDARGLGAARKILGHLEEAARHAGLKSVQLDTNKVLAEAQALYRSAGYKAIARYSDNPYAHHWFGKDL